MTNPSEMVLFLVWAVLGFIVLEVGAGYLHRYVFHGFLWRIHQSHHRPARGRMFEWNDVFAVIFASVPMALMMTAPSVLNSPQFAMGAGMTVHGLIYFVIHDLMTHNRWMPLQPRSRLARYWVQAHRIHHQKVTPEGQGPWGLFFVRIPGSPKI